MPKTDTPTILNSIIFIPQPIIISLNILFQVTGPGPTMALNIGKFHLIISLPPLGILYLYILGVMCPYENRLDDS